jgi:hypothetical protein
MHAGVVFSGLRLRISLVAFVPVHVPGDNNVNRVEKRQFSEAERDHPERIGMPTSYREYSSVPDLSTRLDWPLAAFAILMLSAFLWMLIIVPIYFFL